MQNILHICRDFLGSKLYSNLFKGLSELSFVQLIYVALWRTGEENEKEYEIIKNAKYFFYKAFQKYSRGFYFYKIKRVSSSILKYVPVDEVNLIHAHSWFTDGGAALLLKRKTGIHYIVTIRNSDINVNYKYLRHARPFAIKILDEAEIIVFLSPSYQKFVHDSIIAPVNQSAFIKKSLVIPNGIDSFWFRNRATKEKELFRNSQTLNFLLVGDLLPNKNILETIRFLRKLGRTIPLTFKIIGRPIDVKYAKKITEELRSRESNIEYLGPITSHVKLLSQYKKADIFILASTHETFGLVYIEALSQANPILYTSGQGVDGYFEEGQVGFAIDIDDYYATKRTIEKVVSQYSSLSRNTLDVLDAFKWERISSEYRDIYNKIIFKK